MGALDKLGAMMEKDKMATGLRAARHQVCLAATLAGLGLGLAGAPAWAARDSYLKGSFGPVVNWPLIPLHVVLLPDGRVLSYGTDAQGNQTGQYIYDVWDPRAGTDAGSHLTLPNTTPTDIFCSGQIVMPRTGTVLLTGGDRTIDGTRNYSVNDVTLFDYNSSKLTPTTPMSFLRWYPSVLTTAAGESLVLGGRPAPGETSPTPEVYTEGVGWRVLSGATSDDAYGSRNWTYPRAWQAPNGKVFIATIWGGTYYLDPAGTGSLQQTSLKLPTGDPYLPSVMFAPGKILALRTYDIGRVIDINGMTPTAKVVTGVGQDRLQGSLTVMADGRVFASGGSMINNVDFGVARTAKIWNPATSSWSTAATAAKMRLYHSTSLLLPDGRILTGGGGAPGPQTNLNAEIYTPPYLYKQDTQGVLASRPSITSAPSTGTWGQVVSVGTDATAVSKVTLIKTGSATHTVDFDQRFMTLAYTGSGSNLKVTLPASANVAPPGFYLLFVFDAAGVPSVARTIKLN